MLKKIFLTLIVTGALFTCLSNYDWKWNCQIDYINKWGENVSVGLKTNNNYTISVYFNISTSEGKANYATFLAVQNNGTTLIDVLYVNDDQPVGLDHRGRQPYMLAGIIVH